MSVPVTTTPPDKISSTPESQVHELYSVLLKVWIEVMDFPPRKPFSTDSYLPPQISQRNYFHAGKSQQGQSRTSKASGGFQGALI